MLTLVPKSYWVGSQCIPGVMIDPGAYKSTRKTKCRIIVIWCGEKAVGIGSGPK
jgi:hypothetical protein